VATLIGDQPDIAFSPQENKYLVVYMKNVDYFVTSDIYGQIIDNNGTPVGSEIVISNLNYFQGSPCVAYDSDNRRFLVVWYDSRTGNNDIYGQLINSDGTLYGTDFVISSAPNDQFGPAVAYDNVNERFLVAWVDWRTGGENVYAQLVNTNGTLNGDNFIIGPGDDISIAYDGLYQRYLVIYEPGTATNGRFVNANGSVSGDSFYISSGSNPSIAYDDSNNRFLVAWTHDTTSPTADPPGIYGQFINANGTFNGEKFSIVTNAVTDDFHLSTAEIDFNSKMQQYLVTFQLWFECPLGLCNADIYGQLVNANGTNNGESFVITDAEYTQWYQAVAANSNCANFMVAFELTSFYDLALALVGEPCTYSISGKILTADRTPINGVSIALGGDASDATTTDTKGRYRFTELPNGTYTVTPSKDGCTFTPPGRTVAISDSNAWVRFIGSCGGVGQYSISGKVVTPDMNPLPGVTVTLSGDASDTTITDALGRYRFLGLDNGTYLVTPLFTGYIFKPTERAVIISGTDVPRQHFKGKPSP
jgi:hypothetical protein